MAATEDEDIRFFAPSKKVYPQSVSGSFRRAKWVILFVCLGIYYFLPFLRWDRGPNLPNQAVLADIANNRFYFFFIEIWPQEVYYFAGLLIIAAFALFLMNALAGRVWCGYLCPQTVWTDLFLVVERAFEGDRRERMKRDEGPWNADKILRKTGKVAVWLIIAWWTGGAWVLYFADAPTTVRELATLTAPMTAYIWVAILTSTTFALAGIMREQVCLYMCPWPRIQAALTDTEALNVTYRYDRGDPRVSIKQAARLRAAGEPAGDCIDCYQCVAVCPTGIDIRDGSQLGCIQCGLCIDACDSVMTKINRPARLIAYDTEDNLQRRIAGEKPVYRLLRPRTLIYVVLIACVGGGMLYQLATRSTAGVSALHDRNPLYVRLKDGSLRNAYTIRILNKRPETRAFALAVAGLPGTHVEVVGITATADLRPIIEVGPDSSREVRALVTVPPGIHLEQAQPITFIASDLHAGGEVVNTKDQFVAP